MSTVIDKWGAKLPPAIIGVILSFVVRREWTRAALVSRTWKESPVSEALWEDAFMAEFDAMDATHLADQSTWKAKLRRRFAIDRGMLRGEAKVAVSAFSQGYAFGKFDQFFRQQQLFMAGYVLKGQFAHMASYALVNLRCDIVRELGPSDSFVRVHAHSKDGSLFFTCLTAKRAGVSVLDSECKKELVVAYPPEEHRGCLFQGPQLQADHARDVLVCEEPPLLWRLSTGKSLPTPPLPGAVLHVDPRLGLWVVRALDDSEEVSVHALLTGRLLSRCEIGSPLAFSNSETSRSLRALGETDGGALVLWDLSPPVLLHRWHVPSEYRQRVALSNRFVACCAARTCTVHLYSITAAPAGTEDGKLERRGGPPARVRSVRLPGDIPVSVAKLLLTHDSVVLVVNLEDRENVQGIVRVSFADVAESDASGDIIVDRNLAAAGSGDAKTRAAAASSAGGSSHQQQQQQDDADAGSSDFFGLSSSLMDQLASGTLGKKKPLPGSVVSITGQQGSDLPPLDSLVFEEVD